LKGLPRRVVVLKHVLRNALLPTITIIAVQTGWMIGGLIVVESVFGWPGLGSLLLFAMTNQDLPLLQGVVMLIATIYCLANMTADILYAFLNPRIRYA
jgi:peptide/nickel transport system permease protein